MRLLTFYIIEQMYKNSYIIIIVYSLTPDKYLQNNLAEVRMTRKLMTPSFLIRTYIVVKERKMCKNKDDNNH